MCTRSSGEHGGCPCTVHTMRRTLLNPSAKIWFQSPQVLETCMKNCGHMFREKLPFSDMWEELHKVAILKRKVRRLAPLAHSHGCKCCHLKPWL